MNFFGIYLGVVERVADPERLGRIKVRVPSAYGIIGSAVGAVPVDDLPWALPLGLPAGTSQLSGGMDWLPEVGDQVAVQFIDGEPEKPVWSWFMQTVNAASTFKLHQYDETSGRVGKPKRGALTRYGHTIEWNEGSLVVTTAGGYRLFLVDGLADGSLRLSTQLGQFFELDDQTLSGTLNILEDLYVQVGLETNVMTGNCRFETVNDFELLVGTALNATVGGNLALDGAGSAEITFAGSVLLDYGTTLNFGVEATEPFVLGLQLTTFLETLMVWLTAHTHSNGNEGSPTGPPIVPPLPAVQPPIAQLISDSIFGQ